MEEESVIKTFRIPLYQLNYLSQINENQSEALRIVLDKIINENKKKNLDINIYLIITCFGFIFMFFSQIADNIFVSILSAIFGGCLIIYILISIFLIRREKNAIHLFAKTERNE